ncbi:hypothetical protein [uncultured Sunxiuqinia sp.]|uniref:hypothetical protein n=1 Tax=uncultured Sunxiuqinia sp. TaxID=1573825 RepID=UPI00374A8329
MTTEACLKAGAPVVAVDRINEVLQQQERPLLQALNLNINFILDEYSRKLFGEYQHWLDLAFTGKQEESIHS